MNEDEAMANLRNCWRVGDTALVEHVTGNRYIPPAIPEWLNLDDQLRLTIEYARLWIVSQFKVALWELGEPVCV